MLLVTGQVAHDYRPGRRDVGQIGVMWQRLKGERYPSWRLLIDLKQFACTVPGIDFLAFVSIGLQANEYGHLQGMLCRSPIHAPFDGACDECFAVLLAQVF